LRPRDDSLLGDSGKKHQNGFGQFNQLFFTISSATPKTFVSASTCTYYSSPFDHLKKLVIVHTLISHGVK